ncbi:class III lanthionine synthetase LanKC [Streptosporangium sp. NPDC000396]|uniref:class III lanthionine synthetase LanKC n=1 Tax=Streptosporangium sp. NPDC000396 TaxID=3366185 RepID=UPI00368267B8
MLELFGQTLADDEYYAPLASVEDSGSRFTPTRVPPPWCGTDHDIWTVWDAPHLHHVEQGWKIHVSARLERAQHVLDTVADVCFAEGVPFKHIKARFFFMFLHYKHAHRAQSGKFCAIYPPDTETARQLLDRLADALADEEGPYILSDRRYRDSRVVHYRYGSFSGRSRLRPDGTREMLVRDGNGHDAVDARQPMFILPDGITDPFVSEEPAQHQGPALLRHYEIVHAVQPSNAGGTYEARDTRTGRTVFIKEARAHSGLTWDGVDARERLRRERDILTTMHQAAPGLCPEPLDYFTEWEHDFLVTEHVEGMSLNAWVARVSPVILANQSPADFARYYADCQAILESLDEDLTRLHDLGYRFGDINPRNVIVSPTGTARLVDFEAVSLIEGPPLQIGTEGYVPPAELVGDGSDPFIHDRYGMAALALSMLAPLHNIFERAPANLAFLGRDLAAMAPLPQPLWERATTFYVGGETGHDIHPTPEQLDADPLGCLAWLADKTAATLLETAHPDRPDWLFPPPPAAFRTNNVCVAYGTAGVVHALHAAGVEIPEEVEKRLRGDALESRHDLPPGLHVGLAGIAWVLAELGRLDEAIDLLEAADGHPIAGMSTTLYGGRAGIGLTWLALHRKTGNAHHLDRAASAGDEILRTTDLVTTLGDHDAIGLMHGRSGLALFLYYLARDTGDDRYLEAGRLLLHEELDRGIDTPGGGLSFPDDTVTFRAMPYLAVGAAGVGMALTRFVATAPDDRCAMALPRILADTTKTCCVEPGLFTGLAGLAYSLTDHAEWAGDHTNHDDAVRVATGLLKYAVPHRSGIGFLGSASSRFNASLASGGAGVLLALNRVVRGPGDQFFTLDLPTPPATRSRPSGVR